MVHHAGSQTKFSIQNRVGNVDAAPSYYLLHQFGVESIALVLACVRLNPVAETNRGQFHWCQQFQVGFGANSCFQLPGVFEIASDSTPKG